MFQDPTMDGSTSILIVYTCLGKYERESSIETQQQVELFKISINYKITYKVEWRRNIELFFYIPQLFICTFCK